MLQDDKSTARDCCSCVSQHLRDCGAVRGTNNCTSLISGFSTLPVNFARYHHLFSRSFILSEMFLIEYFFILSIATTLHATTCGYKDGNPQSARTAQSGYGCRVDTANGLWGFCPTTVISAKDCGLAGVCVDSHSCTEGCGRLSNRADITTFSWSVILQPF
jgi:hypothetical protein